MRGSVADWVFEVFLVKDLKNSDGEQMDGLCVADSHIMQARLYLHVNLGARAMYNTWRHEIQHLTEAAHSLTISHRTINAVASTMTQADVTSGLVDIFAFEAKIRRLCQVVETTTEADKIYKAC